MAKQRTETYAAIESGEGKDAERKILPEGRVEKMTKEAEKSGDEVPNVVALQTFTIYEAETDEDFAEIVPEEAERMNLANRGLVLKQQQAVRALLMDANFNAVEGAYDLKTACAEKRERRAATPEEKAIKALSSLSDEQREAVLKAFASAS